MIPWRRSFGAKVVAVSAILVGLLACLTVALVLESTRIHMATVDQSLNRGLAQRIVGDMPAGGGEAPFEPEALFDRVMAINPATELYLLDADGHVTGHAAPAGKVRLDRVAIEPVRRFLDRKATLPLYGDDPREPGRRKVFSAAAINRNGEVAGYLYVVLGGEAYRNAAAMLEANRLLRLSLMVLAAGSGLVLLVAVLTSRLLTRRLRHLAASMATFESHGFRAQVPEAPSLPAKVGGDELDELGRTFRAMATRISDQLTSLERVDQSRRELVMNISHDLRTPLATLQGYLETLLIRWDRLRPEHRHDYLQSALGFSQRLDQMIADLFELARLDLGDAPLRVETFALDELAQDLCQELRLDAERKGVRLEARVEPPSRYVTGDIGLIQRALANLVDNAVKFTAADGSVTVRVTGEGGSVRVEVADTGNGIAADEIANVFDRFYRAGSPRPGADGTGLGLAIVKRVVELHGGTAGARSRLGQGSTFWLELPAMA